jgi:hypothetical protein
MIRGGWAIFLVCVVAACGRIGFDPSDTAGGANGETPLAGDGGAGDGGVMPTIGCVDENLGSVLGANVAAGSTAGRGNQFTACSGDGNDVTFGWFAPATASYRIDLCASEQGFDSVLYVRDATCNGAQLACNDDACGGPAGLASRVTVQLTAGQGIVIVVDELFPTNGGNYQLAITQL